MNELQKSNDVKKKDSEKISKPVDECEIKNNENNGDDDERIEFIPSY